ncbi:hypothetical protein HBI27_094830 [Parastagonospora nodorum]|nr:hypothetical protein HBI27_094830 [Parastagonospora nodorum]
MYYLGSIARPSTRGQSQIQLKLKFVFWWIYSDTGRDTLRHPLNIEFVLIFLLFLTTVLGGLEGGVTIITGSLAFSGMTADSELHNPLLEGSTSVLRRI